MEIKVGIEYFPLLFYNVEQLLMLTISIVAEGNDKQGILFLLLLLAGISAACGQFSITKAYTKAPAREISVFDYTQVLFAAILGFLFLEQIPDQLSFLGYAIIIGSAVFKWAYCFSNF